MAKPSRPKSVREPVQVYLAADDRELLERLVEETGLSKAEILRRGIRTFAAAHGGPGPMLRYLTESAEGEWPENVAENHDELLAEAYLDRSRKDH